MPDRLSVCLSVTSESTFSVFSTEQAPSEQQHERKRERKVEEKQQQEEEILDQSPQDEGEGKEEVEEETPGRRRTVDGLVVCPREQLKEELKAAKQRRRDMRIQEGVAVGTASSSSSKGHGM